MLAVKDSRIVYISDAAHVVVSFVSADDYFLHIRRRVHAVQRDLEALHAAGLLDAMPDATTLPRVEEVYEARRGVSGALEGVPVQVLATAAVDLDITPGGRPMAGEHHQVIGVHISAHALDAAIEAGADIEKRAWYDANPSRLVVLMPIQTKRVIVTIVVPNDISDADLERLPFPSDILRPIFPGADIKVHSLRIRNREVDRMIRLIRSKRPIQMLRSNRARTVKIGCTTVRAVRLDDESVAIVRDGFKLLNRNAYRGIEYAQVALGGGRYYIARHQGRWYVAKKVE